MLTMVGAGVPPSDSVVACAGAASLPPPCASRLAVSEEKDIVVCSDERSRGHALRRIPPHSAVLPVCAYLLVCTPLPCTHCTRATHSPAPRLASPSRRLAVLTYGNGVPKALEARAACGVEADVIDSPLLSRLPEAPRSPPRTGPLRCTLPWA